MQGLIILLSLGFLAFLYIEYKKGVKKEMLIAFLISLLWVKFSGLYIYKDANYILFGINLFTLICWTAGLVLLREIYEKWFKRKKNGLRNASIFYVIAIIVLEYVGYNIWGIQLSSNYSGLFNLPLMHMHTLGKIYYLTIGPAYLKLTDYWRVK